MEDTNAVEKAVLGSILLNNTNIEKCIQSISPEHFINALHKEIYKVMLQLRNDDCRVDEVTIVDILHSRHIKEVDYNFLSGLIDSVPTEENIDSYIDILSNRFKRNFFVSNIAKAMNDMKNVKINEFQDFANSFIAKLSDTLQSGADKKSVKTLKEISIESFKRLEILSSNPGEVTGLSTGFFDIDRVTAGLHKENLIILAARPAMGKTALALNIAFNASLKTSGNVLFFSFEMSDQELINRILSFSSNIELSKFKTGKLEKNDWDNLLLSTKKIPENFLIADDVSNSIESVIMHSKSVHRKNELSLIVVDYLQLMKTEEKTYSREQEISIISRKLKLLAKKLKVPVIALSQLNRKLESREDKRPMMSDLRESGSIEQDADMVWFIYRDSVYNNNAPHENAEFIIAKHRSGEVGMIDLYFKGKFTKFENFSKYR